MDRTAIAKELLLVAKDINVRLSVDAEDPMAGERLTSLYTKFHTWATKKGTSYPPGAPVAAQIIKGMTEVGKALNGKMNLTGREAVQALLDAMKPHFTMDATPIPALIRKYGQGTIGGMFRGW